VRLVRVLVRGRATRGFSGTGKGCGGVRGNNVGRLRDVNHKCLLGNVICGVYLDKKSEAYCDDRRRNLRIYLVVDIGKACGVRMDV
jgi:hypothetical protein